MNDQSASKESLHDQFVAKEGTPGQPMSKQSVKAGNTMMIENILHMPAQQYEDGKAVYRVLEVRGRKSGQVQHTPLAVPQYAGKRYLIAPTSSRDWVHNLIASGTCTLVSQMGQEQYHATLTLDDEAITMVRAYMAQLPDWALQQFPFAANASDEEMHAKTESFAVFRLSELE